MLSLHAEKSNLNPKVYSFKQDIFKWLRDSVVSRSPSICNEKILSAIGALRGTAEI
jgi:hypothetical protein